MELIGTDENFLFRPCDFFSKIFFVWSKSIPFTFRNVFGLRKAFCEIRFLFRHCETFRREEFSIHFQKSCFLILPVEGKGGFRVLRVCFLGIFRCCNSEKIFHKKFLGFFNLEGAPTCAVPGLLVLFYVTIYRFTSSLFIYSSFLF